MWSAKEYFSSKTDDYLNLASWASDQRLDDQIEALMQGTCCKSIVDLGCGDGRLLGRFHHIEKRLALDISPIMLNKITDANIVRVIGDVHHIPLANCSVEAAICRQVLHYCDLDTSLKDIHRILKENGVLLIVQMTDYDSVSNDWYNKWASFKKVANRKHLSEQDIINSVNKCGFKLRDIHRYETEMTCSWKDLYNKYAIIEKKEKKELYDFFLNTNETIKKIMGISVTSEILIVSRVFSLISLIK